MVGGSKRENRTRAGKEIEIIMIRVFGDGGIKAMSSTVVVVVVELLVRSRSRISGADDGRVVICESAIHGIVAW